MPEINIERALQIEGWMTEGELRWLAEQAKVHHTIVEIGCFIGRSTRALVDNTDGIVYAVDFWDSSWYTEVRANDPEAYDKVVSKYPKPYVTFCNNFFDVSDRVRIIKLSSIRDFPFDVAPDMVFIDGSHLYDSVLTDIRNAQRMIRKGGLICGHDYIYANWPDVKRAVNESFKVVHNPVDSIWVGEL